MRRTRSERGVAVVWGIASLGLLTFFAVVCVHVAALVVAHRQAQGAADLAALAGAGALLRGEDACVAAHHVARRNRASLSVCRVSGPEVVIDVRVRTDGLAGRVHVLEARSRAGPGPP